MIYDGIITKPPMEEIIEHGWLKDQAAKVHKYLKRWKNKAGKWVYQYKKPKSNITIDSENLSTDMKTIPAKDHFGRYKDMFEVLRGKEAVNYVYKQRQDQIKKARNKAKNSQRPYGSLSSRGWSNSTTPKRTEHYNIMGREAKSYAYDSPSEVWKYLAGGTYRDYDFRNNKIVARGVKAGRKRAMTKKIRNRRK